MPDIEVVEVHEAPITVEAAPIVEAEIVTGAVAATAVAVAEAVADVVEAVEERATVEDVTDAAERTQLHEENGRLRERVASLEAELSHTVTELAATEESTSEVVVEIEDETPAGPTDEPTLKPKRRGMPYGARRG